MLDWLLFPQIEEDRRRVVRKKDNKRDDTSVTSLGEFLDFGQLFKAFGNN